MKTKFRLKNLHVFYQDCTGPEISCVSISFETQGVLPLHLYQQLGINSAIVDISIILEVLKQRIAHELENFAVRYCCRTFMRLFTFSAIFAGGIKIFEKILGAINLALTTPLKYLEYARICKALKIRYEEEEYKGSLYRIEQSIRKNLYMVITGKKIVQAEYKNGTSGPERLRAALEKLEWIMPSLGPSEPAVERGQTLWKPIRDHKILRVHARYNRQWDNGYSPIILYCAMMTKLTYPTSPEGYCPVVEPSSWFLYYRTRTPLKQWFYVKDLTLVAEKYNAERWFHWGNTQAMIMANQFFENDHLF
ncbi:hypothetical protein KDA11_04570, partial [Candidatus Saccharibacteria bacterium]|nr:hypothetical protein [Candidatus Saccharibacteria bacterium]